MRILLIRHGDPDYEHDTLTPEGEKEAKAFAAIAPSLNVGDCYVSPLGRAQKTASYTLEALGITAKTEDWLREFPARVNVNLSEELKHAYSREHMEPDGVTFSPRIVWDMYPSYYASHPEYWDPAAWRTSEVARCSDIVPLYDRVTENLDSLLAAYGYVRDGRLYRAEHPNHDTVTFFCHLGISCVLLSHLFNISPFILWHTTCLMPTSVTEVIIEEREKGIAAFRALRIGDISHLTAAGLKPAFAARFCETYSDNTRH